MPEDCGANSSWPRLPDHRVPCTASRRVHYFNITYACNSRCRFCAADVVMRGESASASDMPLSTFIGLLRSLGLRAADQVVLNGGEPTVHPDFLEFVSAVARYGSQRTVFTNGRRLANSSFCQAVAAFQPVELLIPIYSVEHDVHDACTGVEGSLAQALQGIRNTIDLQKRGFTLPIEIRLLLSRTTAPQAVGVVRFLCRSYRDGSFCFSLNPLIVSRQAKAGGHVASLFSYVDTLSAVRDECAEHGRELITKNLPQCLVWTVDPERATSAVVPFASTPSEETYFDPLRLTGEGASGQGEFVHACTRCVLRATCPGFPIGHTGYFGDADARPVAHTNVIRRAAELLSPLVRPDDRIDVSAGRHVRLPDGSTCLVEPQTGSWLSVNNGNVLNYLASHSSASAAELTRAFADVGPSLIADLLLSGVGRWNGRCLAPKVNDDTVPRVPSISALVVKYTRDCNLACAYCYAHGGRGTSGRGLPNDTIVDTLDSLEPVLAGSFDLIIHGGEPLARLEDLMELVGRLTDHALADRMAISIQTNAALITDECAQFLHKHGVAVGVSVDGITLEENAYRTLCDGSSSLADSLVGIQRLLTAGVTPGLILVLHKKNQGTLLSSLKAYSSFGIPNFVVNPLFLGGAAKSLGSSALAETDTAVATLRDVLLWINDENEKAGGRPNLYERNLSTLMQHLVSYQRPYMCARAPCGAGLNTLSIDVDGSVYPCDDFMSAPQFRLGSVADLQELGTFFAKNEVIARLHRRSTKLCTPCRNCTWRAICPSHCAAESFFATGDLLHGGVQCDVMRRLIPIVLGLVSAGRVDPQLVIKSPMPLRTRPAFIPAEPRGRDGH